MNSTKDQIFASNQAGTEFVIAIVRIQVSAFERFSALTFNATKTLFEHCLEQSKALLGAKGVRKRIDLNVAVAEPSLGLAIAYSRSMFDVAIQAQSETTKVMEAHAGELKKSILKKLEKVSASQAPGSGVATAAVKSAVTFADSAYESLGRFSKQATDLIEANFNAAMQGVTELRKPKA